jgi:uncharacterized membrane protein
MERKYYIYTIIITVVLISLFALIILTGIHNNLIVIICCLILVITAVFLIGAIKKRLKIVDWDERFEMIRGKAAFITLLVFFITSGIGSFVLGFLGERMGDAGMVRYAYYSSIYFFVILFIYSIIELILKRKYGR